MTHLTYYPQILIGNWKEESHNEKEREKKLMEKIQNEELLIQKSRKLASNLNREIDVSLGLSGYLNIGDGILISPASNYSPGFCISANLNPDMIMNRELENKHSSICLSKIETFPKSKHVFTICAIRSTCNSTKQSLRYGENFMLCMDVMGKKLFLSCRSPTSGGITNNDPDNVFLNENPSQLSWWNLQYFKPEWRFEYEGCKISTKESFILNNSFTNQSLAIQMSTERLRNKVSIARHKSDAWTFITASTMQNNYATARLEKYCSGVNLGSS